MPNLIDVYATKTRRKGGYYYIVRSSLGIKLSDTLTTLSEAFEFCKANNLFLRALK